MCRTHRAVLKKCVMKGCGAAATAKLLLPVSTRMFICNTHRCSKHTPTHTGAEHAHSAGCMWYDHRHGCVLPAHLRVNGPFLFLATALLHSPILQRSGLCHMYIHVYMMGQSAMTAWSSCCHPVTAQQEDSFTDPFPGTNLTSILTDNHHTRM